MKKGTSKLFKLVERTMREEIKQEVVDARYKIKNYKLRERKRKRKLAAKRLLTHQ